MKMVLSLLTVLASSSAFAYGTGSFQCGPTKYEISNSNVGGLPLVTVTGFNNTTFKGLGQLLETTNEQGQKVETIKYNLGARALQIVFVDGKTSCQSVNN
jgi:hypothetical protein